MSTVFSGYVLSKLLFCPLIFDVCIFFLALIQELMVENSDLRESLKSMQTELVDLLNHHNDDYENENNTEVSNLSHNFVLCCYPFVFINIRI